MPSSSAASTSRSSNFVLQSRPSLTCVPPTSTGIKESWKNKLNCIGLFVFVGCQEWSIFLFDYL